MIYFAVMIAGGERTVVERTGGMGKIMDVDVLQG
jgi:hypothetical protein